MRGQGGVDVEHAAVNKDADLARLLELQAVRGLLSGGETTIYGQPALRRVQPDQEPQPLMEAGSVQRRLVECAHAVPATEDGLCAGWVKQVFCSLGFGMLAGDAADIYGRDCPYTDTTDLKVGMVVATPREPYSVDGRAYGHIGLYVGDGLVMDSTGGRVRRVPLELWLSAYGVMARPRWGWLAGIALDQM